MSDRAWRAAVVEDNPDVRRQIREYLQDETFADGKLEFQEFDSFEQAKGLVRERKADVVILDIFAGEGAAPASPGSDILDEIRSVGFAPVVVYTALPEKVADRASPFIRIVGKEAGGLPKLKSELDDLFALRIPQIHQAIWRHLERSLRDYMWGFVQRNWVEFKGFVDKPEFLRLLLQRLGRSFARDQIAEVEKDVYGTVSPQPADEEMAHPAEYYVKPPLGTDPMMGDIRTKTGEAGTEYWIVLWPSCDMVSGGARVPKTDRVLCAGALPLDGLDEYLQWKGDPSATKKKRLEALLKNNRDKTPDRHYYLPGLWDLPHLVVDLQRLGHFTLPEIKAMPCPATLASPFAEALSARFGRYVLRPGTPDLDVESILSKL